MAVITWGPCLVCLQKELQGAACDHAPIGLESRLHLQPVEIAIQTGQQGDREAHVDDRRRFAFGTTPGLFGVPVCVGRFLPSAWRGTAAMIGSSMAPKGWHRSIYDILQKTFL